MSDAASIPTASWARRIVALLVDWAVCSLVVVMIVGPDEYTRTGSPSGLLVLGVFIVETALFGYLLAGSFGKLVTGLRLVPNEGPLRPHNPAILLVRQILVALVIPPLVFRGDGRGLHDLFARTKTVTNADLRAAVAAG